MSVNLMAGLDAIDLVLVDITGTSHTAHGELITWA